MNLLKWIKNILKHLTEEPSAPIVIEAPPKKIIMATKIEPVVQVRDWVIQKIKDTDDYDTAIALVAEFEEWLDLDGKEEIDYLCIETES
jgi:hypothetical protein